MFLLQMLFYFDKIKKKNIHYFVIYPVTTNRTENEDIKSEKNIYG